MNSRPGTKPLVRPFGKGEQGGSRNRPSRPTGRIFGLLLVVALLAGCAPGGCRASGTTADGPVHVPVGAQPGAGSAARDVGVVAAPSPARPADGTVVRVRDGDSLVVLRRGVGVEVRLHGIDCPELAQAWGRRAKRFTSDLAFGSSVALIGRGLDEYGRELAEVMLPGGRSLNRELVAAGYAWCYRGSPADPQLQALERQARAERRGLWADKDPLPPWEFRKTKRR